MQKTTFMVRQMDCSSEEQLIRLKLQDFKNIRFTKFDIPNRKLEIHHTGDYNAILTEIDKLKLDTSFIESVTIDESLPTDNNNNDNERKLLLQVLSINVFFFLLEILMGFISNSMGLIADSLDMLADSFVYGLAIFAIGGTTAKKKNVAKASGYLQLFLAFLGITEVIRRFLGFGDVPTFQTMIVISTLALIGNATCLILLQKSKSTEAHIRASMIFTSNDVIINIGVIVAGVLVFITNTKMPDLIVGAIVFYIVARGAYRILQISN